MAISSLDDRITEAAAQAAQTTPPRKKRNSRELAKWPLESELVCHLCDGLVARGIPREMLGANSERLDEDWDPLPGALDLYEYLPGDRALRWAAEVKLEEVGQTLWDLLKLATLLKRSSVEAAYLIVAASSSAWAKTGNCCELFPCEQHQERRHSVADLMADNKRAWQGQLKRDTGEPQVAPTAVVVTSILAGIPMHGYPDLELRVSRVDIADETPLHLSSGLPT